MNPIHLFISIPCCKQICDFCSYRVHTWNNEEKNAYVRALEKEIRLAAADYEDAVVTSVTLGGGSPTVLPQETFRELFHVLRESFHMKPDAEITVECIPSHLNAAWMQLFGNMGVNRVSLGMVTGRREEAERLGMCCTTPSTETALILTQMFHVNSFETVLLYGIPGQTAANFRTSLRFAVKYHSPEITLRPMEEPATSAWQEKKGDLPAFPPEEEISAMQAYARRHLTEKGYTEYRPGHWSTGYQCADLLCRESNEDYLSFGPGTVSRTDGVAYRTESNPSLYVQNVEDPEKLYTVMKE